MFMCCALDLFLGPRDEGVTTTDKSWSSCGKRQPVTALQGWYYYPILQKKIILRQVKGFFSRYFSKSRGTLVVQIQDCLPLKPLLWQKKIKFKRGGKFTQRKGIKSRQYKWARKEKHIEKERKVRKRNGLLKSSLTWETSQLRPAQVLAQELWFPFPLLPGSMKFLVYSEKTKAQSH